MTFKFQSEGNETMQVKYNLSRAEGIRTLKQVNHCPPHNEMKFI